MLDVACKLVSLFAYGLRKSVFHIFILSDNLEYNYVRYKRTLTFNQILLCYQNIFIVPNIMYTEDVNGFSAGFVVMFFQLVPLAPEESARDGRGSEIR